MFIYFCLLLFQSTAHLLCLLITWFTAGHVTSALPTTSANHRHRHGTVRSRHSADTSPARVDTLRVPTPGDVDRVVFAERPPTSPPWFTDRGAAAELLRRGTTHGGHRRTDTSNRGRRRRSAPAEPPVTLPSHPALLQPVCDSVSEWVQRFQAEDVWGNQVRVVQEIDNGSSRVNQYFYETRCSRSDRANGLPPACSGIDSVLYESVCYETHVWAYARVAEYSRSGDGWTFVKIRASCNCGLVLRSEVTRGHRLGLLHDIAG